MPALRALGVDAGTANLGLACVTLDAEGPRCVGARYVATHQDKSLLRAMDDVRRLQLVLSAIDAAVVDWRPDIIAIEWYAPRQGGQRHGWKTVLVVGAVVALAWCHATPCHPQLPAALRRFAGDAATKQAVIDWATAHIVDFAHHLTPIARGKRDHVADAAGHAWLALTKQRQLASCGTSSSSA